VEGKILSQEPKSQAQWLSPVILATQEAERSGGSLISRANSSRDPILKNPTTKKELVEWLKI
jgi:hypothetical protein